MVPIVQTMDNARTPIALTIALSFIQWIVLSTLEQQMPDPKDEADTSLFEIKRLQIANPASEYI